MEESKIIPINLGFVNAYLVKIKSGFVLIDTGLSSQFEQLDKQLVEAGCNNLKLIILTHGDIDHTGNCKALKEKYKSKIAMTKTEYDFLKSGEIPKRKIKKLLFKIIFGIFIFFRRLSGKKLQVNFKPDIFLKDGNSLKKFGLDAKILEAPGHTKGSIVIYTKDGDLFSGDTIVNNKKPIAAYIVENQEELDDSMKKIKALKIKNVYPGHGKEFSGKSISEL